jgi:peptidyl-tRNA hydrolase, PTH1 family
MRFFRFKDQKQLNKMKYLIVGLGNIGSEYENTRHNIGFDVLDALAGASNTVFAPARYGDVATIKHKGRILTLLKPSTYMNLSGKAVRYWLEKEKIETQNLLVIVDDLALPTGSLRMRAKGSDAGHNGLKSLRELLGTEAYARVRIGIGSNFGPGQQVDYVLGKWTKEERELLAEPINRSKDIILSFVTQGCERTMNLYNKKGDGRG